MEMHAIEIKRKNGYETGEGGIEKKGRDSIVRVK